MTGKEGLGPGEGAGRGRDVHVVEDHGGRLAAELEGAARDPLSAYGCDPPPGSGRPGKGDLVDARIADQPFRDLTIGRDNVEHAGRQSDRLGDLGDPATLARSFPRGI